MNSEWNQVNVDLRVKIVPPSVYDLSEKKVTSVLENINLLSN